MKEIYFFFYRFIRQNVLEPNGNYTLRQNILTCDRRHNASIELKSEERMNERTNEQTIVEKNKYKIDTLERVMVSLSKHE